MFQERVNESRLSIRQAKYILENMLSDYREKKWDATASDGVL